MEELEKKRRIFEGLLHRKRGRPDFQRASTWEKDGILEKNKGGAIFKIKYSHIKRKK